MEVPALGPDVVGEGVDAPSARAGGREVVQAVEQAAVDEGDGPQQFDEAVRVCQQAAVAVLGEVAVRGVGLAAEGALFDLGVQGGEEQVLEHGAVVVRLVGRVVLERVAGEAFLEQLAGDQPLLLQEPDEEQAGDQPDDVALLRPLSGAVVGEAGVGDGPLEPPEQVLVEAPVQRLDVEHALPRGEQAVEVPDAPVHEAGQRQIDEDVDVRPVRLPPVPRVDVLDQGHPLQHVAAVVPLVGAAVDGGQRQGLPVAEQDDDRHGEAAVDGARRLRQFRPAVGAVREVRRHEQEGLGAPPVEFLEQLRMAADLVARDLEDDIGRTPRVEQPALPVRQGLRLFEQGHEFGDAPHVRRPLAAVAEGVQQRPGLVPHRAFAGEAGQRLGHGVTHRPGPPLPPRRLPRR